MERTTTSFLYKTVGIFHHISASFEDYLSCVGIHGDTQPIGRANASDQIPQTPAPGGVMIIKIGCSPMTKLTHITTSVGVQAHVTSKHPPHPTPPYYKQ